MTSLDELLTHYRRKGEPPIQRVGSSRGHFTVFSPGLLRDIAAWYNRVNFWQRLEEIAYQETDDKVGNGHTIVWQVRKYSHPDEFLKAGLDRARLWVGN